MLYGSGFFVPPKQTPLPNMRPWVAIHPEMLSAIEAEVLKNINQVMRLHAQPPLGYWLIFSR